VPANAASWVAEDLANTRCAQPDMFGNETERYSSIEGRCDCSVTRGHPLIDHGL
jgi:hypothetical protein